jgi:hypothetical protein
VDEDIDGLLRNPSSRHLVLGKFQTRLAHTQILGRAGHPAAAVRLRGLLLPRWWRRRRSH